MEKYEEPELEVIAFDETDVIVVSGCSNDNLCSDCAAHE